MTARDALAGLLARPSAAWPVLPALDTAGWLAAAQHEDIVALVDAHIREAPTDVPAALQVAFADAVRGEVAQLMLRQAQTRRALARFEEAGLRVLMLKGSALAYWAYPAPHLRRCADVDLLFASRADAVLAAGLLVRDGYQLRQHFGDAATREFVCRCDAGTGAALELDMHWALSSAPVFADRLAFEELMAQSIALPTLAPTARGLGPVHALLHACIHRASDVSNGGGEKLKWLYDLHLLAGMLADADWGALVTLAPERGLAGVCAAGLEETSRVFGTTLPASSMVALRDASARESLDPQRLREWAYFQRQNLRALPGWRARARWIWQRLHPTAHYREDVGVAGGGLLRDRVQRALRQLRR